jgi:ketosteroid isomerase-like protein
MGIRVTALIALICLVASAAIATGNDDRTDIQALYFKLARSMSAKDANAVLSAGTSDLTFIEKGRTLTGSQIAHRMEQRFRLMSGSPRCRFTIPSLSVKGKSASVLSNDFTEAEVSGSGGRTHKIVATGRSRDELVKTRRGWLLKSVNVLTDNMTMDGKPFGSSSLGR